MSTVLPLRREGVLPRQTVNMNAAVSGICVALSILYFIVPHSASVYSTFRVSILFVFISPAIALVLSLLAIRQIGKTRERGIVVSYISLGVTTLYFITALAIPLVLLGFYLVYSFLL